MITSEQLNQSFLREYDSQDAIAKYSTSTAGYGVSYLIGHEYGRIYDQAIAMCRRTSGAPLRLLEFGCGAGMNVIGLVARLAAQRIPIKAAYGTDFSSSLIERARRDSRVLLPDGWHPQITFHIARNERLATELAAATDSSTEDLLASFDFVFGVNTFRYCHRLGNAKECADSIYSLLRPGGVCVMIDMNDRFPFFRSRLRGTVEPDEETYLPSLREYSAPFAEAGFEIATRTHFCWIPHSAGRALTRVCRALTPVLNATARSRAMRSLVVAKRPI